MDTGHFQGLDSWRSGTWRSFYSPALKLCRPALPASVPCPVLPRVFVGLQWLLSIFGPSAGPFLFCLQIIFCPPLCPQGLDEPEGWGSQLAGLNFAGWEFFRVLIKRNHPERMTSLVHTHTLLPCPLQCPHSHAGAQAGPGGGAHGQRQGLLRMSTSQVRAQSIFGIFSPPPSPMLLWLHFPWRFPPI